MILKNLSMWRLFKRTDFIRIQYLQNYKLKKKNSDIIQKITRKVWIAYVVMLKNRAMWRLFERTDFCILRSTSLLLAPTSCLTVSLSSLEYPPNTSKMMLCWCILNPLNCVFNSYFCVFSCIFDSLFSIHGQLISNIETTFFLRSTIRTSILLFLTSSCSWSANNGTSQKACAYSFS